VHLTLRAKVPRADQATFEKLIGMAKTGCPVSKLLKAEITLDATLIARRGGQILFRSRRIVPRLFVIPAQAGIQLRDGPPLSPGAATNHLDVTRERGRVCVVAVR
jgi:hypothetical protein